MKTIDEHLQVWQALSECERHQKLQDSRDYMQERARLGCLHSDCPVHGMALGGNWDKVPLPEVCECRMAADNTQSVSSNEQNNTERVDEGDSGPNEA